jgi:hypothetical protein
VDRKRLASRTWSSNLERNQCAFQSRGFGKKGSEGMGFHGQHSSFRGGFGARISAWRHFKGCRADIFRGYHGGLSCRSSLIPRAVITFLVSRIE